MQRRTFINVAVVTLGLVTITAGAFAQQAPAGRGGAAPQGPAPAGGLQRDPVPALLFRETWTQPPVAGELTEEARRVSQGAVTNSQLELKTYGPSAREIGIRQQEGRFDLWTGLTTSPVAILLRHKESFIDLSGISKLRAIVRTNGLHVLYPMVRLADGTYLAGTRGVNTDGHFVTSEWAFGGTVGAPMRWFALDTVRLVTRQPVGNPDLSRVDEVGFVDLMPGGGAGQAGWSNVSTIEVYAKPVAR